MSYIHDIYANMANEDVLKYVNYRNIEQNDKEFIRDDIWNFEFLTSPLAVYFPGNNLIQARLMSVDITTNDGITQSLSAVIRQFKIQQSHVSGQTDGTLTLNFTDREDQAISLFLDDWREKIASRQTKFAYRKVDTICDTKYTLFNTTRTPIRDMVFYTCQLKETPLDNPQTTSDDPGMSNTQPKGTLSFEHYEVNWHLSNADIVF